VRELFSALGRSHGGDSLALGLAVLVTLVTWTFSAGPLVFLAERTGAVWLAALAIVMLVGALPVVGYAGAQLYNLLSGRTRRRFLREWDPRSFMGLAFGRGFFSLLRRAVQHRRMVARSWAAKSLFASRPGWQSACS
jgi:hypothetical protein